MHVFGIRDSLEPKRGHEVVHPVGKSAVVFQFQYDSFRRNGRFPLPEGKAIAGLVVATDHVTIKCHSFAIHGMAAGLTLDPSDAGLFSLAVSGQSLVLTASAGVTGDYNGNGVVDAADYTVWRDNLGTNNTLLNNSIPGPIGEAHYNQWKVNFGATGSGGSVASAAVPEPTTLVLAGLTTVVCSGIGRTPRRRSTCG